MYICSSNIGMTLETGYTHTYHYQNGRKSMKKLRFEYTDFVCCIPCVTYGVHVKFGVQFQQLASLLCLSVSMKWAHCCGAGALKYVCSLKRAEKL